MSIYIVCNTKGKLYIYIYIYILYRMQKINICRIQNTKNWYSQNTESMICPTFTTYQFSWRNNPIEYMKSTHLWPPRNLCGSLGYLTWYLSIYGCLSCFLVVSIPINKCCVSAAVFTNWQLWPPSIQIDWGQYTLGQIIGALLL